jgi:hypothetical protein
VKDGGYFKLYRRAFRDADHGGDPLWLEKRVWSRAEAWLYLLSIAAYGPHDKPLRGGRYVHLERGEFYASLRFLGRRWGWSKNKVAKFLSDLVSILERISHQKRDRDGDTYLINNFDFYQSGGTVAGTVTGQSRDTGGTKDKKEEEGRRREDSKKGVAARLADKSPQQHPPAMLTFPCIGKPGEPREWGLTAEYAAELTEAYSGLDVLAESRRALVWIRANRPKTARGMKRFLTSWLDRAAQRAPKNGSGLLFTQPATRFAARRADSSEASGSTVTKPKGWS